MKYIVTRQETVTYTYLIEAQNEFQAEATACCGPAEKVKDKERCLGFKVDTNISSSPPAEISDMDAEKLMNE